MSLFMCMVDFLSISETKMGILLKSAIIYACKLNPNKFSNCSKIPKLVLFHLNFT